MPFQVPEAQFDAGLHARRSLLTANRLEQVILQLFIEAYHDFWGVSNPSNGSIYTTEQIQLKIESMSMATAIQVLTAAAGLVAYINMAYPETLNEKYYTSAFDYTIGESGLVMGGLKEVWNAV
jgi:hypothetical protein